MKSKILTRVDHEEDRCVASAFGSDGEIAIGVGPSEAIALELLNASLADFLSTEAAPWLETLQYAGAEQVPNCGHGTVKLPIDLWYCELFDEPCPIQAQVFLDDRQAFFRGCLADEDKKADIFSAVAEGRYGGFHHVIGRAPCVRCEVQRGNDKNKSYFYPWELSCLEHFTPFVPERDMPSVIGAATRLRLKRAYVLSSLCAICARAVTEILYPDVAKNLRIVERDVYRPEPRRKKTSVSA